MKKISATDFYNYKKCKYLPYINKHGDESKKNEVSRFVQMLWDKGTQHEDKIVKEYVEKNKGKSFVEIDKKQKADTRSFLRTLQYMKDGVDFIYQGVLMHDDCIGRPDLLQKVKIKSNLGDWMYIPVDIKSGSGYEGDSFNGENMKESYRLQLAFYDFLLNRIQGVSLGKGVIVNINGEKLDDDLDIKNEKFLEIFEEIAAMNRGQSIYEPTIGGKCGLCSWQVNCREWAEKRKDLSLLYSLGEAKYRFYELNIKKIGDILKRPLEEWVEELPSLKKQGFLDRVGETTLRNFYKRNQVFMDGKEKIYSVIKFPLGDKEIHFDIEDDPTQDFVYLFGFWVREKGKDDYYHYILAKNLEEEEKIVHELWDFLEENKGIPIYHYSPHEISTLRRLQKKYKMSERVLADFEEDAFDLFKTINKKTDWPLSSYGLKAICKYLGFKWSSADAGGANSIEWFAQYLEGNDKILDKILKYNKEDCMATAYLKDYLENAEIIPNKNKHISQLPI
jgi:predicted RecB family nuclease